MTIPLPLLAGLHFLFGLAVAYASRATTRLSARSVFSSRPHVALLVSEGILGLPVAAYLYVFHRDWSLLYAVDGSRVPSAVAVAILLALPGAATVGFATGVALLRARRDAVLGGLAVGVGVAVLVAAAVLRTRLLADGTYGGFHGRYGVRAASSTALGPIAAMLTVILLAGWGYVVWRAGREAKPRSG